MKDKQSYEMRDEICLLSAYYEWCSKEWMNIYERKRIQSCATEHFLSFHAVLMNGALWKFVPTHHSLLKSNLLFDWNLRFDIIYFYVLIVKNFVLLFACAFALSFQLFIIIVMAFERFVLLILWTLDVAQFCRKTIYLGVLLLLQAPQ